MSTEKRKYVRTLKAYIVTGDDEDRIVRAYTPTEALQYCMPQLKVRLASTDDVIWHVIFPFVLEHCGRNKLLELGKLIDEMLEKEYGRKEGFEELVAGYQLTQSQE